MKCPPNCLNCHRPMAPKKTANPPAVVRHAAHGLCDSCNTLAHRNANPPPPSVRYADPAELLEVATPRPYWMDAGLAECVGADPELFYPHDYRLAYEAKQICGACKFANHHGKEGCDEHSSGCTKRARAGPGVPLVRRRTLRMRHHLARPLRENAGGVVITAELGREFTDPRWEPAMEPDVFTDLVTTFHGQVPFVATPWRDLPGCGACVPCPVCGPNPTDLVLTYRYWVPGTEQRAGYYSHTAEMRLCGVCASWEIRQLIRPDARRLAEICSVEILMIEKEC